MDADVALLQEVGSGLAKKITGVYTGPREHWDSHVWNSCWYKDKWRKLFDRWPIVVKLSDRVKVNWFKQVSPVGGTTRDEIAVSGIGTIAAARIVPQDSQPFIAVSMYARWITPHPSAKNEFKVGFSDGSAHRIISDLSAFIGSMDPNTHRILVAGDLNMYYGMVDAVAGGFAVRERTVWDRMNAIGLEFLGPQFPNGRQAVPTPTPKCLPPDTKNVPTYCPSGTPREKAADQLDYVFASRGFHKGINVQALNDVECWGASDHCRLLIDVDA
jgi:hypothetical protein